MRAGIHCDADKTRDIAAGFTVHHNHVESQVHRAPSRALQPYEAARATAHTVSLATRGPLPTCRGDYNCRPPSRPNLVQPPAHCKHVDLRAKWVFEDFTLNPTPIAYASRIGPASRIYPDGQVVCVGEDSTPKGNARALKGVVNRQLDNARMERQSKQRPKGKASLTHTCCDR